MVSGTRESEQPIHRIWGCWPEARVGKRSGLALAVAWAHCLFWWRACLKVSVRRRKALSAMVCLAWRKSKLRVLLFSAKAGGWEKDLAGGRVEIERRMAAGSL